MTINGTLPVRLDSESCKIVGTQLATTVKDIAKELHADVSAAVHKVEEATQGIRALTAVGSMLQVDRFTDTVCASFDDALESRESAFVGGDLLPLSDEQRVEAELAARVRQRLLADGTSFVHLPYRQQWARMEQLDRDIQGALKELDQLGLGAHARRLQGWITLYGQRLGITQSNAATDAEAQAVVRWHDAWQELVDAVRGHLLRKDPDTAGRLLRPYDEQVEATRQARRDRRKKTLTDS
jgi:hypothetical protein